MFVGPCDLLLYISDFQPVLIHGPTFCKKYPMDHFAMLTKPTKMSYIIYCTVNQFF